MSPSPVKTFSPARDKTKGPGHPRAMDYDSIRARLTARRDALGLTKKDVAAVAGCDPTYVGKIEKGQKAITLRFLDAAAPALDTTLSWLMFGGDDPTPTEPAVKVVGHVASSGRSEGVSPAAQLESVGAILGHDGTMGEEQGSIIVEGAGPGWWATRWAYTVDPATLPERDPTPEGEARRWDLQAGDVVVWRPVDAGDVATLHDDLVLVRWGGLDGDDEAEARILTRDRGGVGVAVLHPVSEAQTPELLRGEAEVVAVMVELRRRD